MKIPPVLNCANVDLIILIPVDGLHHTNRAYICMYLRSTYCNERNVIRVRQTLCKQISVVHVVALALSTDHTTHIYWQSAWVLQLHAGVSKRDNVCDGHVLCKTAYIYLHWQAITHNLQTKLFCHTNIQHATSYVHSNSAHRDFWKTYSTVTCGRPTSTCDIRTSTCDSGMQQTYSDMRQT